MVKRFLYFLYLLPRNILVGFMIIYRRIVSPLYGQVCKYYPSCSHYALDTFKNSGVLKGSLLTTWRILRCNPWSHGGIDDPLPMKNTKLEVNKYGFVRYKKTDR